jgi:hypothetical protein
MLNLLAAVKGQGGTCSMIPIEFDSERTHAFNFLVAVRRKGGMLPLNSIEFDKRENPST